MAKKPTGGLRLEDVLGSKDFGGKGANKARLAAAIQEAQGLKAAAKEDKHTVGKAVPTLAQYTRDRKQDKNEFKQSINNVRNDIKNINSSIDNLKKSVSNIQTGISGLEESQQKALGMLGEISTAVKAIQEAQKKTAASGSTGTGGSGVGAAIGAAASAASTAADVAEMAKAAAPTKWSKFMGFLERKAPKLFARVGVRLMSMGAGMAIPGPGWVWTAVNVIGSLDLAWEVYNYWKEFNGDTAPSSGDKGPSSSKDIKDLQQKASGSSSTGGSSSSSGSSTGGSSGSATGKSGATPSTGSSGDSFAPATPFSGPNKPILDTIKKRESGGNYQAQAKGSSASGAYQFIDGTWQSLTKKFGIGTEYPRAALAPPEIQDKVADAYISEILSKNNGDVSKVPLVWYTGNAQGKISAAAMAVNGGLTPEAYQAKWMKDFAAMGGKAQDGTATAQTPPTTVPSAPRPNMPGTSGATGATGTASGERSTGGTRQAALDTSFSPTPSGGQQVGEKPQLTTIRTASGKTAQVGVEYAKNIQGFVNDLEATGYKINSIGGYADRPNANNPRVKSYHAMGAAIDINPEQNPNRSTKTDLPPETASLAAKWGLGWGMNWRSVKDPMHFSAARAEQGSFDINRGGAMAGEVQGGAATGGGPMAFAGGQPIGGGMGGMRMPGMGGGFGGALGAAAGGIIGNLMQGGAPSAAARPQSGAPTGSAGKIFSGVDYQSNGKPVVNPDGSINWGDPDNSADFFRASQAMQNGAGKKTESEPAATPKKKEGMSAVDKMKFGRGAGNHAAPFDGSYGPQQPMGPELPPMKAAQLAALNSDDDSVGYRGKSGQILTKNIEEAAILDAERKKDADRAAEKAQQERYAAMERDDADQGAAARLAQDAAIAKQTQAGVSVANQQGTAKTLRNATLGDFGPEAQRERAAEGQQGRPSGDGTQASPTDPGSAAPPSSWMDLFDHPVDRAMSWFK